MLSHMLPELLSAVKGDAPSDIFSMSLIFVYDHCSEMNLDW
jgi:hypothetical protein